MAVDQDFRDDVFIYLATTVIPCAAQFYSMLFTFALPLRQVPRPACKGAATNKTTVFSHDPPLMLYWITSSTD